MHFKMDVITYNMVDVIAFKYLNNKWYTTPLVYPNISVSISFDYIKAIRRT